MAPKLRCPACGTKGRSNDESVFEMKGVYRNRPLLHCRSCIRDFTVPVLGGPKLITYEESMALIEQRMDRRMAEFFQLGEEDEVAAEGEGPTIEDEASDESSISRDELIEHFHTCTGDLLVHDDSINGHEWLTLRSLARRPPQGAEAEDALRTYGDFWVAVLGNDGRTKMLRERFEFPLGGNGPLWRQPGDKWIAYSKYSANLVLIWSDQEGSKLLDSRWERLDAMLARLGGR